MPTRPIELQPLENSSLHQQDAHPPLPLLSSSPNDDNAKSDDCTNNDIGNEKIKDKSCEDFDEILEMVGSEGKFQKIFLYAVICPLVIANPFLEQNKVFLWDIPDHFCHVPGQAQGMSLEEWKNLTLPWEVGPDGQMRHSQCQMIDQSTKNVTKCQFGWEYDKYDYDNTISSTYNWVCEQGHYATDCFAWSSVGAGIGSVICGVLADKFGRRPIFFWGCFGKIALNILSLYWAHDILVYKIIQFLAGIALAPIGALKVLICVEVCGSNYRAWVFTLTWMVWVLGNSLLPFIAMVCRGWFLFAWVTTIPGFLMFLYYRVIFESPRWLITVGERERAVQIILKIARTNGNTVDPERIDAMARELGRKIEMEEESRRVEFWTLFSDLRIAKNLFMLSTVGTMSILLYDGVTLNSTRMAGNRFLNYFYVALVELPGGWVAGKLADITGRRWTATAFFGVTALSSALCAVAVTHPGQTVVVILGALGIKFGTTITEMVGNLQGTEIFPTKLRSTGCGLAGTAANVFGFLGPYIAYTGTAHVSFPYILLILCSCIGVVSASCLPETFKQNLPETVEDANKLGKGQKFWSYLPPTVLEERAVPGKRTSIT